MTVSTASAPAREASQASLLAAACRASPKRVLRPWILAPTRLAFAMWIVAGCASRPAPALEGTDTPVAPDPALRELAPDPALRELAPGLELRELAPGVWLHTTWREFPGGRVPSNGLVVADGDGLLLIDSAWGDEETTGLVERVEAELGRPIETVVATHHHEDRLSGTEYFHERGIPVTAHPLTRTLVAEPVRPPAPLPALASVGDAVRVGPVEVFYPGPGHAVDNVVVWVPGARLLFGGCLIRPAGASSLGNVQDADLESWPEAVARIQRRYAHARVVVPGHGPPTGLAAVEHTARLLRERTAD